MTSLLKLTTGLALVGCLLAACGRDFKAPSVDDTGDEIGTTVPSPTEPQRAPASAEAMQTLSLAQVTNVRKLVNGVLEFVVELPAGSRISVPVSYVITQPDFRNSAGAIERSSTGFVGSVTIVSASGLSSSKIASFNKQGLYVSASVVAGASGVSGDYRAIDGGSEGTGFLSLYASTGKPKFNYTSEVTKRFGSKLNRSVETEAVDKTKYAKIFAELARVGNRKSATPKSLLLMDRETAKKYSLAYETNGTVTTAGAWTIAVTATAVRHGFENVPCAEFMSEMIRQAYQRAGYSAAQDFGVKNPLIWSKTASVQGLSAALNKAGWTAWEPSKYRPPTGAIMMHGAALSPGHTFMAAGDDGRLVIDNGSPQGRDLRTTTESTLRLMYKNGVFFLPPGITPKPW